MAIWLELRETLIVDYGRGHVVAVPERGYYSVCEVRGRKSDT